MAAKSKIEQLAKLIRYFCLVSTTEAGSGHPTSSLSAADLMATLFFGSFFRFDAAHPNYSNNDRLIFSKGHASPLFYALWAAAGQVSEKELLSLRKFGSPLEGHPTPAFRFTEAATGSLGQGLSIGVGMAINAKYIDKLPYRTFVLLGDSEMAEGSQWEAIQIAAHYKLNNLIGILDVNRLGQREETMYGHRIKEYVKRLAAFNWNVIPIDGHSVAEIRDAYARAEKEKEKPTMIVAKTLKGKGVSFLENKEGWHGKALPADQLESALKELGRFDRSIRSKLLKPRSAGISNSKFLISKQIQKNQISKIAYEKGKSVATRKAYGNALARIFPKYPNIVVLDAEVSNSTYSEIFQKAYPERFFEMFIAEQNMAGVALGLSRRGKIPFSSTFAAFFTRAYDQIRMSQYSGANIKFCGSHAGVSIGQDGASQMGLEDIAMFRTILGSTVFYPSDAVSCEKLTEEAARINGIVYIRTTRSDTPILYDAKEKFFAGGSKTLRESKNDLVTIVAAGITLYEALGAYDALQKEGIAVRVIDCYSIKPIDKKTLERAARETKAIITVEDHFAEGGLGEAVASALSCVKILIHILAVRKMPKSGVPQELLDYEKISRNAIIKKVKEVL